MLGNRPKWPMTHPGTEKSLFRKVVVSTDRAALLWMYCREIAPYETPTFSKNVGELIARATSASQNEEPVRRIRTPRGIRTKSSD
jgi:hypothetical protein